MRIRPLDDRVVVLPDEAEEKTPGGIFIPDNAKEKPVRGKVLAVGPGRYSANYAPGEMRPVDEAVVYDDHRIPMTVKVGDAVYFNKYSGSELKKGWDDQTVKVMRESDILAVVCEDGE